VFALDRAGLVGEDGPTQHGAFDIAYMRLLPNMQVMAPKDENELRHMLYTAVNMDGPVCLRYPRGSGVGVPIDEAPRMLPVGEAEWLTPAEDLEAARCAVLAYGSMVQPAQQAARELAAEGIPIALINARWAKPLDEALIVELARVTGRVITIEDGSIAGGFGSAVGELLHARGLSGVRLKVLGLPDQYVQHGSVSALRGMYGLSAAHVKDAVRELIGSGHADRSLARSA
jgi:1-deoxy-D-xylulose-5-phosphate synthase